MLYERVTIRKRKTNHTGGTPTVIATKKKDSKNSTTEQDPEENKMAVKDIVKTGVSAANPTSSMFRDLAMRGVGISLGLGASRIVGAALSQRLPSVGPISNQTLTAAGVTGLMAVLAKKGVLPEITKNGAAASAAVMLGSLVFDGMRAFRFEPNAMLSTLVAGTTGASPVMIAAKSGNSESVDLDTKFA